MNERPARIQSIPAFGLAGWLYAMISGLVACSGGIGGTDQAEDPVIQDIPVAYVERPLDMDAEGRVREDDLRDPLRFRPGARLLIKRQASPVVEPLDLSGQLFPAEEYGDEQGRVRYDVRDLSVSPDGTRLLFAAHAPPSEDDPVRETWNLWEYALEGGVARRVMASDILANEADDLFPVYLPDGRILFSSTRQRQSRGQLLDEGKPQFAALDEDRRQQALVLHVMNPDGSDIQQISFNQSHDLAPLVLPNGKIAFSRWENAGTNNELNLYQMNMDGSGLSLMYGSFSHQTPGGGQQFRLLDDLPDGRWLALIRPFRSARQGGSLVAIDVGQFLDESVPIANSASSPAMAETLLLGIDVRAGATTLLNGWVHDAVAMKDGSGRFLVSWSPCRMQSRVPGQTGPGLIEPCPSDGQLPEETEQRTYALAPPLYGLWIYAPEANTMQPLLQPREGIAYTEVQVLKASPLPELSVGAQPADDGLKAMGMGRVDIRSVYDLDGVNSLNQPIGEVADPVRTRISDRPAQFIRIERPVAIPDRQTLDFPGSAFGYAGSQSMREVVGYVPVEPDGSARFAVPSERAFALSVTDGWGRRLTARHQNWLQVPAGGELHCHGCHDPATPGGHGRTDAGPAPVYEGAPTTGLPHPNTRPDWFADMGETMAQTRARFEGLRWPSLAPVIRDEWPDPAQVVPAPDVSLAYRPSLANLPATPECLDDWQRECRAVIHYPTHVQPLWHKARGETTCTRCHAGQDANGLPQVPAAQLDLSDSVLAPGAMRFPSYEELLGTDFEQVIEEGELVDRVEQVTDARGQPVFELDESGVPRLDDDGNPIPVLRKFPVTPPLSPAGALASPRFFSRFLPGGTHEGWLSRAEIRLLAEWIDLGGQYFNDPFAAGQEP